MSGTMLASTEMSAHPYESLRVSGHPISTDCQRAAAPMLDRSGVTRRALGLVALAPACWLLPGIALAGEAGPGFRTDLGIVGGVLHFLGSYPFVLLFTTLALGTKLGRLKLGFFTLGSTAATLLVGIAVSLWAYLGYDLRYAVPALLTTVFLNLFMFAVGLKVGPQFFAGLRRDGAKGVAIAVVVVGLNFAIALGGAKLCGLVPGFAPGLISGSMTDTAVIGVATSAIESRHVPAAAGREPRPMSRATSRRPTPSPISFPSSGSSCWCAICRAILRVDTKAAARAAEESYGGGEGRLPSAGTEAAYTLERVTVDVRAYRVEADDVVGLSVHDLSLRAEVPVLQVLRGNDVLDLSRTRSSRRATSSPW